MSIPSKFLPDIEHHLRRADALRVPDARPLTDHEFELRWPRYWTIEKLHLALTLVLIEINFQVSLKITNGGFGCYKLTISIENVSAETAAKISKKILSDTTFQKLLKDAGAVEILRDKEREQKAVEEAKFLDSIDDEKELEILKQAIALAEEQSGLEVREGDLPSQRIARITKQVDALKEANSGKAEAAQKSAWWLGDVVGGIIGGFTKSMGQ